jgi:hypothetical protein
MRSSWSQGRVLSGLCTLFLIVALVLSLFPHSTSAEVGRRIYVVERDAGTVRQYSAAGDDLGVFASGLDHPGALTADGSGNIYVSESFAGRGHKYSPAAVKLLTIVLPYQSSGVTLLPSY